MSAEYKSRAQMLLDQFNEGRPPVSFRWSKKTGQLTQKMDKRRLVDRRTWYKPETEIKKLAKKFPKHLRVRVEKFYRFFFMSFYQDRTTAIPSATRGILEKECRLNEPYLAFFEQLLADAGTVGFPSVMVAFLTMNIEKVQMLTDRSLFDVRNLLALRIYLADQIVQVHAHKVAELHIIATSLRRLDTSKEPDKVELLLSKMLALFGSNSAISQGVTRQFARLEIDPDQPNRYKYHRDNSHYVYLPDIEQAKNLMKIGALLGRSENSARDATHLTVGRMTRESVLQIFPDLFDAGIAVKSEIKQMIESAFGMPYDQAKELIKTEFEMEKMN